MQLTRSGLYALKLTLNQGSVGHVYRTGLADKGTNRSAMVLATVGLSVSMFSLKQMLSSPAHQRRLRRLH